jgi:hypothetical protein
MAFPMIIIIIITCIICIILSPGPLLITYMYVILIIDWIAYLFYCLAEPPQK